MDIGAFEAALVLLVILGEWQLGDYTPWKMNGWAGSPKSHKQLKKQQHHLNRKPPTVNWFFDPPLIFLLSYYVLRRIPCPLKIASTSGGGEVAMNQSSAEVLEGLRNAYGNLPLSVAQGEDSEFSKTNGFFGGKA